MRKVLSVILVLCLFVSCMSVGAFAAGASSEKAAGDNSRYTGLVSMGVSMNINDLGRAVVSVSMHLRDGYKAQLRVDLHQEGLQSTVPKTWNKSIIEGGEPWAGVWYVAQGYLYYATVTLDVYTTSGTFVERVTLDSNSVYY